MRPWYRRLWLWSKGDWWTLDQSCPQDIVSGFRGAHHPAGRWGIYHPYRRHSWDHPYANKAEAQLECDKRNGKS